MNNELNGKGQCYTKNKELLIKGNFRHNVYVKRVKE